MEVGSFCESSPVVAAGYRARPSVCLGAAGQHPQMGLRCLEILQSGSPLLSAPLLAFTLNVLVRVHDAVL